MYVSPDRPNRKMAIEDVEAEAQALLYRAVAEKQQAPVPMTAAQLRAASPATRRRNLAASVEAVSGVRGTKATALQRQSSAAFIRMHEEIAVRDAAETEAALERFAKTKKRPSAGGRTGRGIEDGKPSPSPRNPRSPGPVPTALMRTSKSPVFRQSPKRPASPSNKYITTPPGAVSSAPTREVISETRGALIDDLVSDMTRTRDELLSTRDALQVEREHIAQLEEDRNASVAREHMALNKMEELEKAVDSSNAIAENALRDQKRASEALEMVRAEANQTASKKRAADLEVLELKATCSDLSSELASAKDELSRVSARLASTEEEFAEFRRKLIQERDEAVFRADEMQSQFYAEQKRHAASLELSQRQKDAAHTHLRTEADRLTTQLAMLRQEMVESEKLRETERITAEETKERLETQIKSLKRKLADAEGIPEKVRAELKRELAQAKASEEQLENHVTVLLERAEALQRALETAEEAAAKHEAHATHLNDVNHVLAVRLKAAIAESEASLMEQEAKALLVKQNEEMERQLADLRRVVNGLMAKKA